MNAKEKIAALALSKRKPAEASPEQWEALDDTEKKSVLAMSPEDRAILFTAEATAEEERTAEDVVNVAKDISISQSQHSTAIRAREFASHIPDALMQTIGTGTQADKVRRQTTLLAYEQMTGAIGDRMAATPIPGTTKSLIVAMYGDGDNVPAHDRYEIPKKKADGTMGTEVVSFWETVYASTAYGKALLASIEAWEKKLAAHVASETLNTPSTRMYLKGQVNDANDTYNKGLSFLRKAAALWHQVQAVKSLPKIGGVVFLLERGADGKETTTIMSTPKPVKLWEKGSEHEPVLVSVDTFNRYDVQAARTGIMIDETKEGISRQPLIDSEGNAVPLGGLVALDATVKRAPKETVVQVPTISKLETSVDMIGELATWYSDGAGESNTKHIAALRAYLLNDNNAEERKSYYQYMSAMDDLWTEISNKVEKERKAAIDGLDGIVARKGQAA